MISVELPVLTVLMKYMLFVTSQIGDIPDEDTLQ